MTKHRHSASLRLRCESKDTAIEFSKMIGSQDLKIGIKGEQVYKGSNLNKVWQDNFVFIKSPLIPSEDLEKHILYIFNRIESHREYVNELTKRKDLEIDIFCSFTGDELGNASIFLKPELFKLFSECNIGLELSII